MYGKSLGLLKSFFSYASQLSGASILGRPSILGLIACGREWRQLDGRQRAGIVLPMHPPGSEIHIWRAGKIDSCDIFVYSYGRKYSISHLNNPEILKNVSNHTGRLEVAFWG